MSKEIMQTTIKENYEIIKNEEGKFTRKAVYNSFSSIVPETKAEKIEMMNLLNGDGGEPLGQHIGKHIEIADVIFNPYDKINEETGESEFGVLTYIVTPEKTAYVTSSKSVYFSLKRIFQVFGEPHYAGEDIIVVKPVKKKGQNFNYTDIQIVG